MSKEYEAFLASKALVHVPTGIEKPGKLHESLFPFQSAITAWNLRRGRSGMFEATGLGKTRQQVEFARHVERHTKKPVLILAPLAVSAQTQAEGAKMGIEMEIATQDSDIRDRGIFITNYQKLHKYDPAKFDGVVLDEASILKGGVERATAGLLTEMFASTPFKLVCTATPAPNDTMELGTYAEFLGVMTMSEMLSTFFVHDGGETQKWRLKGHAESDFWRWMASWCVCIQKPSDLGYSDEGYILPGLHTHEHITASEATPGYLFAVPATTLKERRGARRVSLNGRVDLAAELANANLNEQWVAWCNLNDEGSALAKSIQGAVEIKGGDSDEHKEKTMLDFSAGKIRAIVSKPSICGHGMNWQNCHNTAFVGLSDSWEQLHQAVRRFWRYGQQHEVHAHLIISEAEGAVLANIKRKERDAQKMQASLVEHMADISKKELRGTTRTKLDYLPTVKMKLPGWLTTEAA